MDFQMRMRLSPVALATVVALLGMSTAATVPWLGVTPAAANHCTPACDCNATCDCACNCDCAGVFSEDQPERLPD